MPKPPAGEDRFLDLEIPDWFVLDALTEEHGWLDWGFYGRHQVERLEDGSYVCLGDGVPIYLRCLAHRDEGFDAVDGTGRRLIYRLRPHPPPGQF